MRAGVPIPRTLRLDPSAPLAETSIDRTPATRRTSAPACVLTAGGEPPTEALMALDEIAALPFVESVLALPDLHFKDQMESPSSVAITTRGTLVPEFTSAAINDGMGLLLTDLEARDLTRRRLERLLTGVGRYAAAHPLDCNRYSLGAGDLRKAAERGASAVLSRYGLDADLLERIEHRGAVPVPEAPSTWDAAVPWWLTGTPLGRAEVGLNFGGNHFLELQEIADVFDPDTARAQGLTPGRVVVMYHLGPGPFGGNLLHHYSRREKVSAARAPWLFLSRLFLHLRRKWRRPWSSVWHDHFQRNRWTALPEESEGGQAFLQALALATNVGYAYRMATVAAVRDAVHERVSTHAEVELVCDVSHNLLREEPWRGGKAWVARHNACPVSPGALTIVAGAHDVPSILAIGGSEAPPWLHSHDHGAGHLIASWRRDGRLTWDGARAVQFRMGRGHGDHLRECDEVPVCTPAPLDRLIDCLASHDVLRPVVRLRPLGTLKN